MKFVMLSDIHWGNNLNSQYFLEKHKSFFTEEFFPYLLEHKIKDIWILGDFFDDRNFISYQTMQYVKRYFVEPCIKQGLNLNFIIGNHDTKYKNTNSFDNISVLLENMTGSNVRIINDTQEVDIDGKGFLCSAWLNKENLDESLNKIKNSCAEVCMGHFEINGFVMNGNSCCESYITSSLFKKFKKVFSGHFHNGEKQDNIQYLGTPIQLNWGDYNKIKGFYVFDTTTMQETFVEHSDKIFDIIFIDEEKDLENISKENIENKILKIVLNNVLTSKKIKDITDRLMELMPFKMTIDEKIECTQENITLDLAKNDLDILKDYVEQLEHDDDIDKNLLLEMLITYYNKAVVI